MSTKILKQVSLFRHLRNRELQRIMTISSIWKFAKGDIIFDKQEVGNHFFIVRTGKVKIFTETFLSRRKTLAYLGPGDFFGEMALLGGKVRSASAQAMDNCELLVIQRKKFKDLICTDREFTFKLLHTMSERLRKADSEIESLLFQNMLGRLVQTLVTLVERRHKSPIAMNISLQELADFVGTTREPLSRALAHLKKGNTIEYKNKQMVIKDLARLKAMARQSV